MVAERYGRVVVHVDEDQLRQGVRWAALNVRLKVAYGVALNELSKAIGRAEWLARGGN